MTKMSELHDKLIEKTVRLNSDYHPFGELDRWKNEEENYPDCSMGCKHYRTLQGELGADWGVCVKITSPRFGLLTFEHQAGKDCFEG
ncbi:hypothetical protein EBR43_08010 [bacterium]|nr:hypothetical protein [bacterium]